MGRFDRYAETPSLSHFKPARREGQRTGIELAMTPYWERTQGEEVHFRAMVRSWVIRRLGKEYLEEFSEAEQSCLYIEELCNKREYRETQVIAGMHTEAGRQRKRAEKLLRTMVYAHRKASEEVKSRLTLSLALSIVDREEKEQKEAQRLAGLSAAQVRKSSIQAHKAEYLRENGGKNIGKHARREVSREVEELTG